jgi:hypothetical protein
MTFICMFAMLGVTLVLLACAPAADPRVTAFEKRVQQLQDERVIREVVIRYGEYPDARDQAGYAQDCPLVG